MKEGKMQSGYKKLFAALSINTVVMFLLTYIMIASLDHFNFNINKVYMALVMAAPMGVVMLILMRSMFQNQRLNTILYAAFIGLFLLLILLIRTQTPVSDQQFLRSMIPHHSSAILMCEQAQISDPEIQELCVEIIQTQQEEINQMKEILSRNP